MLDNKSIKENSKFNGFNFNPEKYVKSALKSLPVNYSNKELTLAQLEKIIKQTEDQYNKSSEKFIDVLLNNYQIVDNVL